jgi:uncharacterized protein (DUF4415 family)
VAPTDRPKIRFLDLKQVGKPLQSFLRGLQTALRRGNISRVSGMSEDFGRGKRGPIVRAHPNKVRITIRLDGDIVDHFKRKVLDAGGGNYQTLINDALRRQIEEETKPLEDTLRRVIREELSQAG